MFHVFICNPFECRTKIRHDFNYPRGIIKKYTFFNNNGHLLNNFQEMKQRKTIGHKKTVLAMPGRLFIKPKVELVFCSS